MTDPTTRREFVTTAPGGLDRDSLPLRLWEKAKRLGVCAREGAQELLPNE